VDVLMLLVALDESTRASVHSALGEASGLRVAEEPDLESARRTIEAGGRPTVVVIEAAMLRKHLEFPPFVYLAVIAGPEREGPALVGQNEILRRPLRSEDLRVRLDRAARALQRDYQPPPEELLRTVLAAGRGGEMVVRSGRELARVHVEPGKVAWVRRAHHPVQLNDILTLARVTVADDTVHDIVQESRASRRHFAEVLVEWGIVDHDLARECLRSHLVRELTAIFAWPSATSAFVEDSRQSSGVFTFTPGEILGEQRFYRVRTVHEMAAVSSADPALVDGWLRRMTEVPHVLGCALVEPKLGTVLGSRGIPDDGFELVWEMAGAFAALGSEAEETLSSTRSVAYLVRSVRPAIPATAVVVFDPRLLSPAMARIQVTKASALE